MSVWAVVPAYNEEALIAKTVEALYRGAGCNEVIVIDDGSQDHTAAAAARAGARVARLARNGGKGRALAAGIREAVRAGGDSLSALLLADADLGASAARLSPLVEAVKNQGCDLAIASFRTRGGFGLAKKVAASGIRALTGRTFESPLSGQRALSSRALAALRSLPAGWGVEVAMTVRALRLGLRVVEVPVELSHRETGRDLRGFVHRGRQFLAVVATLVALAGEELFAPQAGAGPC